MRVQSWMRSRERGKYDVRLNNCHHFVNELLQRVTAILDDDKSTCNSDWSSSTTTLEVGVDFDEKLASIDIHLAPKPVPTMWRISRASFCPPSSPLVGDVRLLE
jgi:hypothetical protein